jgi:hypothetical protein
MTPSSSCASIMRRPPARNKPSPVTASGDVDPVQITAATPERGDHPDRLATPVGVRTRDSIGNAVIAATALHLATQAAEAVDREEPGVIARRGPYRRARVLDLANARPCGHDIAAAVTA